MSKFRIVGISGNVKRPSRTAFLVRAIVSAIADRTDANSEIIELVDAAPVLFQSLTAAHLTPEGRTIIDAVESADLLVVGSPVYRASYSGALKHLFDLVDFRVFSGRPVALAATGGTPLHGLMVEHQLRPLFGFLNALTLPTHVYAVESDFAEHRVSNPTVYERIERVAGEAEAQLLRLAARAPAPAVNRPVLQSTTT